MELLYPLFLSRQKAMILTGLGRRKLQRLIEENNVKYITTKGGQRRYSRTDILKLIYEQV